MESSDFILIVDDSHTNLLILSQALKSAGFAVQVAADGESALEFVQQKTPTLILLDVQMPGIDGFETCRRLKADPTTREIPILFMTALTDTTSKVTGLSVGGVDYISKPFEKEEVLARIDVHLQLRQMTRSLQDMNETLEQQVAKRTSELTEAMEALQKHAYQQQILTQEKLNALHTLATGVSHEIRNPLNFVTNYAQASMDLIEELMSIFQPLFSYLDPESLELSQEIIKDLQDNSTAICHHSQRAVQIIQTLISHTLVDTEKVIFEPANLNDILAQVVKWTCQIRHTQNPQFSPIIHANYESTLAPVELIAANIIRALTNLLDNACDALQWKQKNSKIDALGEGTYNPMLWIATQFVNEQVEIRIKDNGCGIDPQLRSKIMEPFFTTKSPGDRTGLGLFLAQEIIVNQHQGSLRIESEFGQFTEAIVCLPLTQVREEVRGRKS